jgi:hypothetical protein
MEYDSNYIWDGSDKHGASLKSLELLGRRLGYNLVGTNKNGVNAFFVKKELTEPFIKNVQNILVYGSIKLTS